MNYYEHHLGDYARDTAHLSILEHGVYRLLLDRYYVTEAGIPEDQAHRLARARSKEERQAVDDVLIEFFKLVDGFWINTRAEEEIAKARLKIATSKENGRKGGRPKTIPKPPEIETQEEPTGLFAGSEIETQEKAHQAPSTKHQTKDLKAMGQAAANTQPADAAASPPSDPITFRAIELSALLRHRGAALQASNPKVRAWAEHGITDAQALTALEIAEQRRADKGDPTAINAGLLDAILSDVTSPQPRASPGNNGRFDPAAFVNQNRKEFHEQSIDSTSRRMA